MNTKHDATPGTTLMHSYYHYSKTFWHLFIADLVIFKQYLLEKIVDICAWFSCLVIARTYVYPAFGMSDQFGEFLAFSLIAGESIWRIWAASSSFVADLEGDKIINSYFILPLPSWLIIAKEALLHAFKSISFGILTLSLCTILLWNKITFVHFSIPHYVLIFFILSIFSGFFFIFLVSFTKTQASVDKIGIRILFPLWFFGAAEFPWRMIYDTLSPWVAYACLANPITYVMEGIHAAALGQAGYIPFGISCITLCSASILCGIIGIMRLKKRLDFV
jgi:ABC-2 type transport system permease protein